MLLVGPELGGHTFCFLIKEMDFAGRLLPGVTALVWGDLSVGHRGHWCIEKGGLWEGAPWGCSLCRGTLSLSSLEVMSERAVLSVFLLGVPGLPLASARTRIHRCWSPSTQWRRRRQITARHRLRQTRDVNSRADCLGSNAKLRSLSVCSRDAQISVRIFSFPG